MYVAMSSQWFMYGQSLGMQSLMLPLNAMWQNQSKKIQRFCFSEKEWCILGGIYFAYEIKTSEMQVSSWEMG